MPIHAAMAQKLPLSDADKRAAVDLAKSVFDKEVQRFVKAGGSLNESDVQSALNDTVKGLGRYSTYVPHPFQNWAITDIERGLGLDFGNCIIDIGGTDGSGNRAFADIKFKRNLDARYVEKTIEEYRYDWQFLHYAWALGKLEGRPVRGYLCLVVLNPTFSIRMVPFDYSPQLLMMFEQSGRAKWELMAKQASGEITTPMASEHNGKFGPLPCTLACLKYNLDPILMRNSYIQIKRDDGN